MDFKQMLSAFNSEHSKINPEYFYHMDQKTRDYFISFLDEPDNVYSFIEKGYLLCLSRRYKEAIECYKKGESIFSQKDWYRLGLCYTLTGQFEEAEKNFDVVIYIKYKEPFYYKALYNKAYILIEYLRKDYHLALEYLDIVLNYKSNDPDVYTLKGNCLKKLGSINEAERYYRKSNYLIEIMKLNNWSKIKTFFKYIFKYNQRETEIVYPLYKGFLRHWEINY